MKSFTHFCMHLEQKSYVTLQIHFRVKNVIQQKLQGKMKHFISSILLRQVLWIVRLSGQIFVMCRIIHYSRTVRLFLIKFDVGVSVLKVMSSPSIYISASKYQGIVDHWTDIFNFIW
jgi:hypothetical protein